MPSRFFSSVAAILCCGIGIAQNPSGETAATVNGESIAVAEVDAVIKGSLGTAPLSASQRRHLRVAVLDDLIGDTLVRQFLTKNGSTVEPAELESQMTALKARLVAQNQTLATYLKQLGQTETQLRAEWAIQIQLTNYVKQQATDEKLKAYHAANRDHFDKVEVRVSHIQIRVGRSATPVERAAAREKLQAIRAEILAGKLAFDAAAKKHSQCPSALKGGDLGFIPRRGMPEDEPLAKAAFALKVGALSDVVESDRGLHLLTITDRKPGTPSVIEKCVVEVLEAYTDDFRAALVTKLRAEGQVKVTLP